MIGNRLKYLVGGLIVGLLLSGSRAAADERRQELDREFQEVVRPFLATYCAGCHGEQKQEAKFDLRPYTSLNSVAGDLGHWKLVLRRLTDNDMPPDDAPRRPDDAARRRIIDWIEGVRRYEAQRTAGDPGPVLSRRLSNAEYNYTIHDLTGVDIQPTRDFPVDPANEAGFDNSGESLAMSPALLNKYLAAARHVADHLLLLPDGLAFAPHPVVVYSDLDKYGVHRIVNFYERQPTDLAAYFYAAWRFQHRAERGAAETTLADIAAEQRLSRRYLQTIWNLLNDDQDHAGPIAELREGWRKLPAADAAAPDSAIREACAALREQVRERRHELMPPIGNYEVKGLNKSTQPIILQKDRDVAAQRRKGRLPEPDGTEQRDQLRQAISRFCAVIPDTFYVTERGRMFENAGLDKALDPSKRSTGRLLSAGFHLMFGYFRDDSPLYELILDEEQQAELDRMWEELEFITRAPIRQFSDYIYFERAEYPGFLNSAEFDFAREDTDITSQAKIERLAQLYLAKARKAGIDEKVLPVIAAYYDSISAEIRQLEKSLEDAEPSQLEDLLRFAERAWRRPLEESDRAELLSFYEALRDQVGLGHEDAVRDTLVVVLMSPRFCFRVTESQPGAAPQPMSDYELASRLSYFLWSSLPDEELLRYAAARELHDPKVLIAQTRRMLRDPRVMRLATEFGGNWLEFRRFQTHVGVNRERFPQFTDELRQAMYEEPIRFLADLLQRDGSVLELLAANHTFVNRTLAEHYGIPHTGGDSWIRVDDARRYGRGGLLPMAVFLTRNSPGLRTSPVKRGYWVVRRLLGEEIPPPPPEVPELPEDESQLGELSLRDVLARHREIKSCAQCHERFDSIGLAMEGYGPIGERRERDLGDRAVDASAVFPDGSQGDGIQGLERYLRESRQAEYVDNLCRKLLSYALGRTLLLSDDATVDTMKARLQAADGRLNSLVEAMVVSPQFRFTRGRDYNDVTTGGSAADTTTEK